MRLVQFNDAHIRGTTPRSRWDDYPKAIWNKFQQLSDFITEKDVNAVLNGGDLFDSPDPSTGIVNKYLKLFTSWGIPIYSIVGSHDKFGYNDKTVERAALGTLQAAGVVKIMGDPQQIAKGVSVAGVSHSYTLDENPAADYFYAKQQPSDYLIQLCHGMITTGPFFGKYTLYSQIRTEADLVICSHNHVGFGPYQVQDSTIINIGSMGRTENIVRIYPPGFLYIDTDATPTWKFIKFDTEENPYIEKSSIDLSTIIDMEKFINSLKQKVGNFERTDLKELLVSIGKDQKVHPHILERALGYIESDE